ncbi:MAG: GTPase domain-containing protein [Verrucomicrobiales bacterium]|nr:GTPase domain-containing protein [Verrucomicrobiales bacterium]
MALYRKDSGEVQFKIVYCGPPQGGKTTNLHYIYRRLDPRWRGDLISIDTEQNRTISFDFLPIHSTKIGEFDVKFQLYTVPGQKILKETRRAVLAGADAVVFVADSDPERREANLESFEDCLLCLKENRISPDSIPIVFQYNKRDIPGAVPPHELDEMFAVRHSSLLASATSGYQVFATLDRITQMILQGFCSKSVKSEVDSTPVALQRSPNGPVSVTKG